LATRKSKGEKERRRKERKRRRQERRREEEQPHARASPSSTPVMSRTTMSYRSWRRSSTSLLLPQAMEDPKA